MNTSHGPSTTIGKVFLILLILQWAPDIQAIDSISQVPTQTATATPAPVPSKSPTGAKARCNKCQQLNVIIEDYKREATKEKPDFNALQLKASRSVVSMATKSGKLSEEQMAVFVHLLRVDLPVNPAQALFGNTIQVIKTNFNALEAEVKKLPDSESKDILSAIDVAMAGDQRPPD